MLIESPPTTSQYKVLLSMLPFGCNSNVKFVLFLCVCAGNCQWIRIPSLIYASHVSTTVIAIIFQFMVCDFSGDNVPGPEAVSDRIKLSAVYAPYLVIPLLLLYVMLTSRPYVAKAKAS